MTRLLSILCLACLGASLNPLDYLPKQAEKTPVLMSPKGAEQQTVPMAIAPPVKETNVLVTVSWNYTNTADFFTIKQGVKSGTYTNSVKVMSPALSLNMKVPKSLSNYVAATATKGTNESGLSNEAIWKWVQRTNFWIAFSNVTQWTTDFKTWNPQSQRSFNLTNPTTGTRFYRGSNAWISPRHYY